MVSQSVKFRFWNLKKMTEAQLTQQLVPVLLPFFPIFFSSFFFHYLLFISSSFSLSFSFWLGRRIRFLIPHRRGWKRRPDSCEKVQERKEERKDWQTDRQANRRIIILSPFKSYIYARNSSKLNYQQDKNENIHHYKLFLLNYIIDLASSV